MRKNFPEGLHWVWWIIIHGQVKPLWIISMCVWPNLTAWPGRWASLPDPDPRCLCLITRPTALQPPLRPHCPRYQYRGIQRWGPLPPGITPMPSNGHGHPPHPSPSSHWCPVPSNPPKTIRLDVEGCYAAIDNMHNACTMPAIDAHAHSAQIMGSYFFYFWNISTRPYVYYPIPPIHIALWFSG